jgi:hypothetical protein
MLKSEKDVKKQVKKILDKHDWFWWMTPANGYGKSGVADFCALKNGTFLAIETKFGGNKPTPLQIAYLNSINAEDSFGFVVDEHRVEWLDTFLTHFTKAGYATAQKLEPAHEDGAAMLNALRALQIDIPMSA